MARQQCGKITNRRRLSLSGGGDRGSHPPRRLGDVPGARRPEGGGRIGFKAGVVVPYVLAAMYNGSLGRFASRMV
jgi:hypothetical protein